MSTAADLPVVRAEGLGLAYGKTRALDGVTLDIPAGCMVGLIGPDGVGKSSLLSLIAGARRMQEGRLEVLGGDMASASHRNRIGPRIAFMPQGLGRNLYLTLSVFENIDFFGRLFGISRDERQRRIGVLLQATGLAPFAGRPAGKLSGGMKQKLGLCCALIHDPDFLILDEPTTGVDPLSRRQFWQLIHSIRDSRPGMSILIATAYMEEAEGFDWLAAMDDGRILATGTPAELLEQTNTDSLDTAYVQLLPDGQSEGHNGLIIPPYVAPETADFVIEAEGLSVKFGDFTAVDRVSFQIRRGEIFGFLGSNGCGKTTTMKVLTGLLEPAEGRARLFGQPVDARDMAVRKRIGYMTQSFSLYGELTVRQNLELHGRLFDLPTGSLAARVAELARRFDLERVMDSLPNALPLGIRQRLSLAVALIHKPDILILDEPTSGVDPVARDEFWRILVELSRNDRVTIFVSTHFMNEAARCDRISLMHAGRVLVSDTPDAIRASSGVDTLDDAFVHHLQKVVETEDASAPELAGQLNRAEADPPPKRILRFRWDRMLSIAKRESLELSRDPIRLTLAGLGSIVLMLVLGYGISMDVEDLRFAVLDLDQSVTSQSYVNELSGSRYFIETPPLRDYGDMDRRMRAGDISLALEFPPGFAADLARGSGPSIGAWIDGSNPQLAETVRGYVQAMHSQMIAEQLRQAFGAAAVARPYNLEVRYRYNPDIQSLPAIVPAVIPLLLLLIPAMLAALSVVREKEMGSIVNFYVTPTRPLEFLLGKQMPYVVMAMVNFALLVLIAVLLFDVPFTGSIVALTVGALLYVVLATGLGLLISAFMRSQIAAIFATSLATMLPAVQYGGIINPVSALEGAGAVIGEIYPTSHFVIIARGTFSKALGFDALWSSFLPMLLLLPVLTAVAALLLRKQVG